MAEAYVDDFEDLWTCSVCLENFDNEVHKPKFLSCHHTLCLNCVKSTSTHMRVTCPLCRRATFFDDNNGLPNNNYVLKLIDSQIRPLIKSMQQNHGLHGIDSKKKKWCLKCRKEASNSCSSLSGHGIVLMETFSSENCLDLLKSKDENETKMATIIKKRRDAKSYLNQVCNSLKIVEDEIKRLEEENDEHLVKTISLLEDAGSVIVEGETAKSFTKKVEECTNIIEQELEEVKKFQESYLDHTKGTKIFVQFKDAEGKVLPNAAAFPLFDTGFSPTCDTGIKNEQPKQLIAVFHILLSLLKPAISECLVQMLPDEVALPNMAKESSDNLKHKDPEEIDFVLSMTYFHFNHNYGTVLVKPDSRFYRPFIDTLVQCPHPQRKLTARWTSGSPSQFLLIDYSDPLCQLVVPKLKELMVVQPFEANREEKSMDVRLVSFSGKGNTVSSFQLGFQINPSQPNTFRDRPLFGRIIEGREVVEKLANYELITHIWLQKQQNSPISSNNPKDVKLKNKPGNDVLLSNLNQPKPKQTQSQIVPKPISTKLATGAIKKSAISNSIFAMTFTRRNLYIGTVLVKPDKNFYRPFIEGLAGFCQSPKAFGGQIEKTHSTFVTFQFSHKNFRQEVPDERNFRNDSSEWDAENALDVGFFDYNYEGKSVIDFQLMFLLKSFNPEHMRDCSLFGKIVGGKEVIEELTKMRKNERSEFTVSIEFQKL